jgi:type IV pilus assembly protein PilX
MRVTPGNFSVDVQRGAALVTSLVLLLVLTIIGVSAMQMTRMQERMAGNTRDINLALQGAEAALRDGENQIGALTSSPITCTASTEEAPCGIFERNFLPSLHDTDAAWWELNAQEYGTDGKAELTRSANGELAEDPHFVIEEVGFIRDSLIAEPDKGREFYQITARSTGGSGDANVVVQTTFARRRDN